MADEADIRAIEIRTTTIDIDRRNRRGQCEQIGDRLTYVVARVQQVGQIDEVTSRRNR